MKENILKRLFRIIKSETELPKLFTRSSRDRSNISNLENYPNIQTPRAEGSQNQSFSASGSSSLWIGTIQSGDEVNDINLTLIENDGAVAGEVKVIDKVNSQLVGIGEIISGSWSENNLVFTTDTELEVDATLQNDSLIGTITFPPRNGADSLAANLDLKRGTSLFLPIIVN